jgi:hypothetical protein
MAATGIRVSVEQSLTPEASEVAIKGTAVRGGAKPTANRVRFKESVNLREDLQDFQFRHLGTKRAKGPI